MRHISRVPLAQGAVALSWRSPWEWFVVERPTSLWLLVDVDKVLLRLGITERVSGRQLGLRRSHRGRRSWRGFLVQRGPKVSPRASELVGLWSRERIKEIPRRLEQTWSALL